jgi:hypothetical protein
MELYLDSADIKEIEEAFQLGFLTGLTTTPTFMHREGITDVDAIMLKLSKMVPILQVEALGENAEEIVKEAKRLVKIGLPKDTTVFKILVFLSPSLHFGFVQYKEGRTLNIRCLQISSFLREWLERKKSQKS